MHLSSGIYTLMVLGLCICPIGHESRRSSCCTCLTSESSSVCLSVPSIRAQPVTGWWEFTIRTSYWVSSLCWEGSVRGHPSPEAASADEAWCSIRGREGLRCRAHMRTSICLDEEQARFAALCHLSGRVS